MTGVLVNYQPLVWMQMLHCMREVDHRQTGEVLFRLPKESRKPGQCNHLRR
jgi:hypothetical protein